VLATKFRGGRFEPAGITGNRDIPFASSLVDYVVRWLATRFVPGYRAAHSPAAPVPAGSQPSANGHAPAGPPAALVAHAPLCPTCGGFCVPAGACWACTVCGSSTGCG
jgi:ribonucleoside-diphosphate reductase alpha chain